MKFDGMNVVKCEISEDKTLIALSGSDGAKYWLSAVGDCCSNSWFEHVSGLVAPADVEVKR